MGIGSFWNKDEIKETMRKKGIEPISNFVVGWSKREKALVLVEKKQDYEAYGIKVFLSKDKMQKLSVMEKAHNLEELENAIISVANRVGYRHVDGIPIRDPYTSFEMLLTVQEDEKGKSEPIAPTPQQQIQPPEGGNVIGYICNSNLEVTNNPVFVSDSMVLHHIIVTGSTGGGKTEVAKRIVTEVRKDGRIVLVLTPEPHLWKQLEGAQVISGDTLSLDNGINIIDFSDSENITEEASSLLESVYDRYGKMEQTDYLRLLIVVDEAHSFLENKEHERILERSTRVLRKFGVACLLISHTYADFNRGIRANVQTHIAMYTNWQKDLSYIRAFQAEAGLDYAKLLLSMPEGYGIFRSREFLRNQPVPCRFLRAYEVLQTSELKIGDITQDDAYTRRMTVHDIISASDGLYADDVGSELEKKGIGVSSFTVYSDLEWLTKQGLIRIKEVGERGKRLYTAIKD